MDRLAPNFTPQTATALGTVIAPQTFPKLRLLPGQSDEFFSFQAGATGTMDVLVAAVSPGGDLGFVITDLTTGHTVAPTATTMNPNAGGAVVGVEIVAPSVSGHTYLIHVSGDSAGGIDYTLNVGTLTEDFETQVQGGTTDTTVAAGSQNVFRLVAGVTGTLEVTLTGGADVQGWLNLTLLGANGSTVLGVRYQPAGVIGQRLPLQARAGPGQTEQSVIPASALSPSCRSRLRNLSATLHFTLQFTNFDQSETLRRTTPGVWRNV